MADILVIRMGAGEHDPAHWMVMDASGTRKSPPVTGALVAASADVGDKRVMVLVPSTEVLSTSIDIPVKNVSKLQAALPFALEEVVADDIDNLHFSAGSRRSNGQVPVSVVAVDVLDEWLSRLAAASIRADAVISESYGLARIPGTISLLLAENQVIINDGADIELAIQDVTPGDALAAIGAFDDSDSIENTNGDSDSDTSESPAMNLPRHVLVYCDAADEERYEHDWIAVRQAFESLDVKVLADGIMPRLASTVAAGAGVNLLQGAYGQSGDYLAIFKPWKYAAMLLGAFIVVSIAGKAADYVVAKRQVDQLQQQFYAEYQAIVPGADMPRDPNAALQSLIARVQGNGTAPAIFLQSLEQLGKAMRANESANIQTITFRAGVINVRITAPDVSTLDDIQRAVAQSGQFSATIQSTTQDGDQVNSRIQIQATGA